MPVGWTIQLLGSSYPKNLGFLIIDFTFLAQPLSAQQMHAIDTTASRHGQVPVDRGSCQFRQTNSPPAVETSADWLLCLKEVIFL